MLSQASAQVLSERRLQSLAAVSIENLTGDPAIIRTQECNHSSDIVWLAFNSSSEGWRRLMNWDFNYEFGAFSCRRITPYDTVVFFGHDLVAN
jgi:hypothetical protein